MEAKIKWSITNPYIDMNKSIFKKATKVAINVGKDKFDEAKRDKSVIEEELRYYQKQMNLCNGPEDYVRFMHLKKLVNKCIEDLADIKRHEKAQLSQ